MNSSKVAICMATYNGEAFLREQIDSILNQSYSNWVLFIRDDRSTDSTVPIIQEYANKYPNKIIPVPYAETDLGFGKGAAYNFMSCLKYASEYDSYPYYMFSDQDDVWLPHKIRMELTCARRVEATHPGPVLIHTDLKIVDKSLELISDSMFDYVRSNPNHRDLNQLLIHNIITGCTTFFNQKLVDLISFDNTGIAMHDWWIGLIASCFGTIVCLRRSTVLYRQHGNNVMGIKMVNHLSLSNIRNCINRNSNFHSIKDPAIKQANALLNQYSLSLSDKQYNTVFRFADITNHKKILRILRLIHNQYYMCGFTRVILEIFFI